MTEHLILGVPDSPEQREFLGDRFSKCLLLAAVEFVVLGVGPHLADDPNADDVQLVGVLIAAAACLVVGIVGIRLSVRFGPPMWGPVMVGGCIIGFLMPLGLGPGFAAIGVFAPVFIGGGSHTFRSPRVAWSWTAAVMISFAAGMAVVGGADADGVVVIGFGLGLGFAQGLKTVLERLVAATDAERAARAEADAAREQLADASARKSQFLARVSHELRTPLNAVLGFSGLIHERVAGPLTDKQAEYIDEVVASGNHLLALVDDVLHLSRVEVGSEDLTASRLDLGALVDRSVALFRDQAARNRVRLETDVARGLVVEGDERKLRQVVFNLVSNAVKFTPEGGVVTVRLARSSGDLLLSVSDTGPGIPPAQHDLIFEPFRQAGGEGAPGTTGLGLAVASRFVAMHGGSIAVDSEVGSGATFAVTIPTERLLVEPAASRAIAARSEDGSLRAARGRLILGMAATTATTGLATSLAVVGLSPPATGGVLVAPLLGFGLVGAFAVWLARRPRAAHGRPAPAHALVVLTIAVVTVTVACAGSLGMVAAVGYALPTLTAVALLSPRWVLAYEAVIAVAVGVLFAVQSGYTTPFVRWQALLAFVLLLGAVVTPLVEQLRQLARSEAEATADAERDGLATQAATRHKSEFVATMSHELRTPLNAIIGFSEALREEVFGPITPLQAEYLDESLRAVRHLLALVNDVLELARLEAGRMPELRATTRLELVAEVAVDALARLDPPILAEVEGAAVELEVVGDGQVLARSVVDLVTWVADRGVPGRGAVRLVILPSDGGALVTASAPTGSRADVSDAFDEFGGDAGRARRSTGLGMALAAHQLRRHGGWCTAEATTGIVSVAAWLPGVATPRASWRQEDGDEGGRSGAETTERADGSRQHGPPPSPVA